MILPLTKAVIRPEFSRGSIPTNYEYLYSTNETVVIAECALTRAYQRSLEVGILQEGDLAQAQFVLENGSAVPTTTPVTGAYETFLSLSGYQVFGASQHMAEVGKILVSQYPAKELLEKLFSKQFATRMDLNKFLKILQIMCQPGRVNGTTEEKRCPECKGDIDKKILKASSIAEGKCHSHYIEPVRPFDANVYIDTKHEDDDGCIFVHPQFWDEVILPAYTTEYRPLHQNTTLIKVNSSDEDLTIKGVLKRCSSNEWYNLQARIKSPTAEIILCGNAIKDNNSFAEGKLYLMDQTRFAYHSDSNIERGHRVNITMQLMTRSGMNTNQFIDDAAGSALDLLQGLMLFDEDAVIKAIGAYDKDGKETSLEHAAALKRRIMDHETPPNHPVNAIQIYRLGMVVVREQLRKIDVPGFHGMGAPSGSVRGIVGVPTGVWKQWMREHGTNDAYLFRSPYLGSYCGRFVKLVPRHTDTILVNWEDALQMEGDFDGDQYYVVPSAYVNMPNMTRKPYRPAKQPKANLPLDQQALQQQVIELANSKNGIGPRDRKLSMAFDYYHAARATGDQGEIARWEANIERLQIWVQQAIEGLKHGDQTDLTRQDLNKMFGKDPAVHPYTDLLGKQALSTLKLQGSRLRPGFIERVKQTVREEYSWHPLHNLFMALSTLEFGSVLDVAPYYIHIKNQPIKTFSLPTRRILWSGIRGMQKTYAEGVAMWDGGNDKNINFGKHILGPIRAKWADLLSRMEGNEQAIYEVHLMLANVAYEPQPNWRLFGDGTRGIYPEGVFHKIKRGYRPTLRTEGKLAYVKMADQAPLLHGTVSKQFPKRKFTYRKWVPRTGALFHHLVDGEMARAILGPVLPKVSGDRMIYDLIRAATEG